MYCLDSNIVIEVLRKNPSLKQKLASLEETALFISDISVCELYKGAYSSSRAEQELEILRDFINNISIIGLDHASCEWFGKEFARLQKKGLMPPILDLMIAATARSHNLILVTRNKKDFEHMDVTIEVW